MSLDSDAPIQSTPCVVCGAPVHVVAMNDDGTGQKPTSGCGHCDAPHCFNTGCFERHCVRSHADLVAAFDWTADPAGKEKIDRAREIEAASP